MFGNAQTISLMTIHDDCAGEGANLAFPNMSSCAAIVCVLGDRLVGIHKTLGAITGKQLALFEYAKSLIDNDTVYKIVITGWKAGVGCTVGHDAATVRNALGNPNVATYFFNLATTTKGSRDSDAYKTGTSKSKMSDLCTFAARNGTDFPRITVKRTTKVTNANIATPTLRAAGHKDVSPAFRFGAVAEDVTSSHDHAISQNKFTQV